MNESSSESSLEHRSFKSVINLYEVHPQSDVEKEATDVILTRVVPTQNKRKSEFGENEPEGKESNFIPKRTSESTKCNMECIRSGSPAWCSYHKEERSALEPFQDATPTQNPSKTYNFTDRLHSTRSHKQVTLPLLEINLPRYAPTPLRTGSPIPKEIREKLLPICVLDSTTPTTANQWTDSESVTRFPDQLNSNQTQLIKATMHVPTNPSSDPASWNIQAIDSGNTLIYHVSVVTFMGVSFSR
ncbi:hypothetical protein FGIG_00878 [Fasciola gigantica]|uniref:Uncharacterized protein n=1 Tax=Fasciola gigantica TaxID=46835 RepID=A0A504YWM3_FASGI|nr:hypothetical protein FGIG_00878 [Fasciola gigantica]